MNCRAPGCPSCSAATRDYDAYVAAMVRSGAIKDASHLWWAIRPSLKYPTLELRAPDCCTRLDDTVALAALYRVLARHLYVDTEHNAGLDVVDRSIAVENKWRAQRYGVKGTFVTRSGAIAVGEMLDRVLDLVAADAAGPRLRRVRSSIAGRSPPGAPRPRLSCGFLLKMNTKGPILHYIR